MKFTYEGQRGEEWENDYRHWMIILLTNNMQNFVGVRAFFSHPGHRTTKIHYSTFHNNPPPLTHSWNRTSVH